MTHKPGAPTSWQDAQTVKEALRDYQRYLKAKGVDGKSSLWIERIRRDLQQQGYPVKESSASQA